MPGSWDENEPGRGGGRRGPGSEDVRVLIANVETSDSADARGRKGLAHGRDGPGTEVVRSLGHRTGDAGMSTRTARVLALQPVHSAPPTSSDFT
jgi:hypothetical protein